MLAKIFTTLDVLSIGRAELGIGAAWYEREHRGLGVPFPPLAERFDRLEETIQISLQMWSEDNGPYKGRHYQLAETLCSPAPVGQPCPRILIGGTGLPTAILAGEDQIPVNWAAMEKAHSITLVRGEGKSEVSLADVNLAIVEKCRDPDRIAELRSSFFAWGYVEMVHGLQLSILSETGNAWLLISATATLWCVLVSRRPKTTSTITRNHFASALGVANNR